MLDIMAWNAFIQAFHVNGLTSYIARFMFTQGMDYAVFYDHLWQQIQTDSWWQIKLQETRDFYQQWITDGRIDTWVGGIPVPGWNLHNRLTLMVHDEGYIDQTYQLVHNFLQTWIPHYATQLIEFQRATMMEHGKLLHLPEQRSFDWDFWGHIVEGTNLDQPAAYEFSTSEDTAMSKAMFLENFWFGRKRNFQILRIKKLNC
jgi:hypothetical protein